MKRSHLLDLLRITAIGLVFAAHFDQLLRSPLGGFFGIKNFYYVSLGGIGVSLFLILSGILAGLTDANRDSSYLRYLVKKILRIYPLYLMSVPLAVAGYLLSGMVMDGDIPKLFPNGFWGDLAGSLTGFYSWFGLWGGPYNSPSWFIGLIMSMYGLALPLLYAMKRQPHLTLLLLLAVSVASRWYVGQEGLYVFDPSLYENLKGWVYRWFGFMPGRPTDWFPPCRVFEFGLGIYLALVLPRGFWFKIDLPTFLNKSVTFLSDIAFPLFLIHYPFLFVVKFCVDEWSVPHWAAITLFMLSVSVIGWFLSRLDSQFPRKQIEQKLLG
jgi:peptidoglycan/LPS O-acetylase OafA/YrhL